MSITVQHHQGLHGEAYVFALASAAGLLASRPILDLDGVDWSIAHPGPLGTLRSPKIEAQVKTWSKPVGDDDSWAYRLKRGHFNALAGSGFVVPRYLLLVIVPDAVSGFAVCDADCMKLHHAAYWVSLATQEPVPDESGAPASVAVQVPRKNLVTPEALIALVAGDDGLGGGS